MGRVLRPGGRIVVLEFSRPSAFPFKQIYFFYFRRILPLIGTSHLQGPGSVHVSARHRHEISRGRILPRHPAHGRIQRPSGRSGSHSALQRSILEKNENSKRSYHPRRPQPRSRRCIHVLRTGQRQGQAGRDHDRSHARRHPVAERARDEGGTGSDRHLRARLPRRRTALLGDAHRCEHGRRVRPGHRLEEVPFAR